MLWALKYPLLLTLAVAIGCGVYERVRVKHRPSHPPLAALNLSFAYSAIGFALALLLVFKTNTGYARYWEGACVRHQSCARRGLGLRGGRRC